MSLILDGTNGLSDVDGTAAAPAIRGTDANTGIFFGTDIIGFAEGGVEAARINADSQFVAAAGTAALPVITTTGDTNTGIFFPAADTIAFATAGTEAMRIDSSGNLTIKDKIQFGTDAQTNIQAGGTSDVDLIVAADTNLRFETGTNERARIDSSGNVGIGTSLPTARLSVSGVTPGLTAGDGQLSVFSTDAIGADRGGRISFGGVSGSPGFDPYGFCAIAGLKDNATASNFSGYLTFSTSTSGGTVTERARINSSGTMYLGYGNQAPVLSGADVQGLSMTGPSSTLLQIYMLKAAQVEAHFGFNSSDSNLYVGTGGGIAGIGTYGLYQANTGTTWNSVSDERFKTELQPIENALDKIANVRAVTGRYTYDEENGRTDRRSFLIAQDFVTALPEAVDQNNPDKLGLSYSDTIPLLVAAIKEQQALITALTTRITALEAA